MHRWGILFIVCLLSIIFILLHEAPMSPQTYLPVRQQYPADTQLRTKKKQTGTKEVCTRTGKEKKYAIGVPQEGQHLQTCSWLKGPLGSSSSQAPLPGLSHAAVAPAALAIAPAALVVLILWILSQRYHRIRSQRVAVKTDS